MKTRIRYLDEGAVEIIRLISPGDLAHYSKDDPLLFEKSIVWLEDVEFLPFVRVKWVHGAKSRRGPISCGEGFRVVGYSKLTPDARRCPRTKGYVRRVFYRKIDDPVDPDAPPAPSSYDPKSIMPGEEGRQFVASGRHSTA